MILVEYDICLNSYYLIFLIQKGDIHALAISICKDKKAKTPPTAIGSAFIMRLSEPDSLIIPNSV